MNASLRVGFVGLGDMGGAIAARLLAAGLPVTLWARRPESLRQFEPDRFRAAETLTELGRHSDVVGICVFGDADVREVVLGPAGILAGLRAGSVVLIHSTVSVATCREIAAPAAEAGVEVLDAPVTGARARALAGELVVLLGGDAAAVEKARPMLAAFAGTTAHLGPLGSGQRMKALNNALGNATGRLAGLAIEIGVQLGLDAGWVIEILRSGSASSAPLTSMVERLMRDPDFADLASRMIVKDTALFGELCAEAGVEPGVLQELAGERAEHIVPAVAASAVLPR
ncbi:MAG TPA: NAD(P)-dependent oxidoreductase [Pseudonocardiaceae bacterium]|jgi:3-hydroxyisobutyrate dehydrogenase-like beta-hydroxyacid dehydrogenase|nr:NAD(P)-dependent oxidoreductase [Pseudonocardiaceae bacterium]